VASSPFCAARRVKTNASVPIFIEPDLKPLPYLPIGLIPFTTSFSEKPKLYRKSLKTSKFSSKQPQKPEHFVQRFSIHAAAVVRKRHAVMLIEKFSIDADLTRLNIGIGCVVLTNKTSFFDNSC
jgi:hypothetical protein